MVTSKPLSEQQAKVLKYLKEQFYSSGSMPTLRELCKAMGWKAVGTAQSSVGTLIEKGYLEKDPQKARGLQLVDSPDTRAVPLLGSAPAGVPLESLESHENDMIIPGFIRGPVFAVRVKGESMLDAGNHDQDILIVLQTAHAREQEIDDAMVQGEVTIKRLVKKKNQIWLYPENSKFKPKLVEDPSFRILGTVIGLHRYF